MTCGASAGLAAAFHAPLAGVMFALEEIHKGFSVSLLISVMTASVTADYICSHIMGIDPVFQFELEHVLPQNYYWMLLILGVILGFLGAFYNKVMIKAQELYKKPKFSNETTRLVIAFLAAGVLGTSDAFCTGERRRPDRIAHRRRDDTAACYSYICGEIFVFRCQFRLRCSGRNLLSSSYSWRADRRRFCHDRSRNCSDWTRYISIISCCLPWQDFLPRSSEHPVTGIILLFEMSGSVSQMLSLAVVSVVAYITATLLKSEPIYESLLNRLLDGQKKENESGENSRRQGAGAGRQKVLK